MFVGDDVYDVQDDVDELLSGEPEMLGYEGNPDLLGAAALLGADPVLLGAALRRGSGQIVRAPLRHIVRPNLVEEVARARAAGGVTMRSKPERDYRKQWLPVPPTVVGAGLPFNLILTPVRTIRLERPIFDATLGQNFEVTQFQIGGEPQFVGAGSIPLSAWAEVAWNTGGKGATVRPGVPIILAGNNIGAAATLRGAFLCSAVL